MNPIELTDESNGRDLYPFTLTRPIHDIRVGILTIREKWERHFHREVIAGDAGHSGIPKVPAHWIPNPDLVKQVNRRDWTNSSSIEGKGIQYPWDIFRLNGEEIRNDFVLITRGRVSQSISHTNRVTGEDQIFLEAGARVENAILNASSGPIYIGQDAEIMEGAMIRGPFAACQGTIVKMGAAIYGATTIGPFSVVGGEIKNSVIFGNSNKAHHGYLGDSVVGEWCNLGAGSSNSNLKNNAKEIRVWNEPLKQFIPAGIKCGIFMGDYSRTAINTSINSGTVIGVCCSLFGPGLTPSHIPSFSWGFGDLSRADFEKAIQDIDRWKKLKNQRISDIEIRTLKPIFDQITNRAE
jgi:UDP-N-acetylglucosamine diphosphorylase / glucose-1-phosphate thymidylyltransferase / UDP-N-acetylgalactosamine diphosphorylase / glucosamine-1-phosphate N-acetyltransferase / galactosamine-1-phosphate N-acetyltransferase